MTEDEAQAWVVATFGAAAHRRIAAFLDRVITENAEQNLISPATIATIWSRHAVDSAQLLALAPAGWQTWIDIGTGGGFPGMIVALLAPDRRVTMVEPRRRRADFLRDCLGRYALDKAVVESVKVEQVTGQADVISARAVASVENLLRSAGHCAKTDTIWLLPRGRSGSEPPFSRQTMFHVEHSLTDVQSVILVGKGTVR